MSQALKNIPLFARLSDEERSLLEPLVHWHDTQDEDVLYSEGDTADRLYFIADGQIKIVHYDERGNERILELLSQGALFGCNVAVFDPKPYHCTAVSMKGAVIGSINRTDYQRAVHEIPRLAISVLTEVSTKLQLLEHDAKVSRNTSLEWRLADLILDLAGKNAGEIQGTHQLLANRLGVSREAISRELKRLESLGYLRIGRGKLMVLDMKALQALKRNL